ncbi:MAG TPA: glycosyltransferase family 4 protein [Opitutaceae bacterium]|nr:glycosyltransferase family 4 protein [Opitutaceae bacterium]
MPDANSPTPPSPTDRRWAGTSGLYFDEFAPTSAWIREVGVVRLPPLTSALRLRVHGEVLAHPEARGVEQTFPSLACFAGGRRVHQLAPTSAGPWSFEFELPAAEAGRGAELRFALGGVAWTNTLAWLGRVTRLGPLQRFRQQHKNRQLRLTRIETAAGETIFDFALRHGAFSATFARQHLRLGLNVVGFFTADLGVAESARCMVRAADAARLPVALVPLKLHCKNPQGDQTYAARLQPDNPHTVNVIHIDAPASRDIDHHHGRAFRAGKYNIGYWAWELPDFPDAWVPACDYFDEIWCPSDFVRESISGKVPRPVLTMPHAIAFPRPEGDFRPRFGLPADQFLFLFAYDLNSYSPRKNPQAVIAAFRASGLAGRGAALVIKTHNVAGNEADFAALQAAVADLPGTVILGATLPRAEVYQLEAACDCFVSLHRSEGFGLAVAECMYLGKPVISTDWSGTAEYVNDQNGCPVRCELRTLEQSHGPYSRGSTWAEPDVAHAAGHMRRLFEDRALAARLGAAARTTIEARFAPAIIGARYRRRLEAIAGW